MKHKRWSITRRDYSGHAGRSDREKRKEEIKRKRKIIRVANPAASAPNGRAKCPARRGTEGTKIK